MFLTICMVNEFKVELVLAGSHVSDDVSTDTQLDPQYEAYSRQAQLRNNMCADILSVDEGNAEVLQYAPQLEAIVYKVMPRRQDSFFAQKLAALVSSQAETQSATLLGENHLFRVVMLWLCTLLQSTPLNPV